MKQVTRACNTIRDAALADLTLPDADLVMAACWEADPQLMQQIYVYDDPDIPTGKAWRQPDNNELAWKAHQLIHRAYAILGAPLPCEGAIEEI